MGLKEERRRFSIVGFVVDINWIVLSFSSRANEGNNKDNTIIIARSR